MDDKRLERMEVKLDDISDHLCTIDVTLAAQHVTLDEHIRRTQLLEDDVSPIKAHVARVDGAIRLLKILTYIAAVVEMTRLFIK